jgi:acetylornithine deacetylase
VHPDVRWDDVDRAVTDGAEDAFGLLERLVAEPSTVGEEAGAQEVPAEALAGLGFALSRLPIPDDIVDHPAAGLPQCSYDGRYDLIGERACDRPAGRSQVINGRIGVVPLELAGVVATARTVTRFLAGHFGTGHFGTTS